MKTDFDIGNLFYILLMIIFILAGAFGKKKKPHQVLNPSEPSRGESPEDLMERKLKEFFGDKIQSSEGEFEISDVSVEKHDVPLPGDESERLKSTVFYEQKPELINHSIEYEGEIIDTIGSEEGTRSLPDLDINSIIDEIKESEGKNLMPFDYNEELEELISNFDARKGLIYSEIFRRREY